MNNNKRRICLFILLAVIPCVKSMSQGTYLLHSPDKSIEAIIHTGGQLSYDLTFNGISYLADSRIRMDMDNGCVIGQNAEVKKTTRRAVSRTVAPLYGINDSIRDSFNELKMECKGGYSILFRAYNEGFAWRVITDFPHEIKVLDENNEFNFNGNYSAYFHPVLSEAEYRVQALSDTALTPNYSSMPVLVKPDSDVCILIHESDVLDYPAMTLRSNESRRNSLMASHAKVPRIVEPGGHMNFNLVVKETEDHIAATSGKRAFPWRIVAFEEEDKNILNNELVYLLATETPLPDVEWIKPGKVAWDWWNALNLTGVDFETGFNTETYKYYIDFASRNNIEYVNLDDGWSDQFDLLKVTDKLDMEELVRYAKEKNVALFLWCVWHTIDKQMTQALDQFEKWGIAGIKVDFMDRDDQVVVNFQERLLREAAKRRILVNYHGAYHPTGMQRTYPNNINIEGVRGLEWNKFNAAGASPDQAVMIPYIRMFAGSLDYTPGAMRNYNKEEWRQINDRPMSQGTRCHQLAMFVVYFAPLQMLSDSPTEYEKDPAILEFLSAVPVVWDQTTPLAGSIGEYVSVARRKGENWYMGGMTGWEGRNVSLPLDFLDPGKTYDAEIFSDGANAHRVGSDYKVSRAIVEKGGQLTFTIAPGGGFAVKLTPVVDPQPTSDVCEIVMFGNSLVEGGENWKGKLSRDDVRSSGKGGFTTSHFVWLLDEQVIKHQPKICFLEGGINDIGVGIPLGRIKQNYQSMVDALLDNNIIPVLQSVLYVNQPEEQDNVSKAQEIDEVNAFLQKMAKSKGIIYIDLNAQLSDNKRLKKEFTTDGIHLTGDAYKIWSDEVKKVLDSKGI